MLLCATFCVSLGWLGLFFAPVSVFLKIHGVSVELHVWMELWFLLDLPWTDYSPSKHFALLSMSQNSFLMLFSNPLLKPTPPPPPHPRLLAQPKVRDQTLGLWSYPGFLAPTTSAVLSNSKNLYNNFCFKTFSNFPKRCKFGKRTLFCQTIWG